MHTPFSLVKIPTANGHISAAIYALSSGSNRPLAVLMPGYLDSKDHLHLTMLADDLVREGFAVIRFDPTGVWESSGGIEEYGVTQYLSDIETVIAYGMGKLSDDNHEKPAYPGVFLIGHSMGGMVSLLYAASHAQDIAGIVAVMSPYAFVRPNNKAERDEESLWAKDGFSSVRRTEISDKSQKREYRVPYSMVQDAAQYNVLDDASSIKSSVLLVAGDQDTIVSPADVRLVHDRLGGQKRMVTLEGVEHDYRTNSADVARVNVEIISWLKEQSN